MSNYQLSKEDENFLNNYRNADGSKLSEAQRESMISIIISGKELDTSPEKEIQALRIEKPKPIRQPSEAERMLYGNTRLQRELPELQGSLEAQGVQIAQEVDLSQYQPQEFFTLKNDDFGRELKRRSNNKFRGTKTEIPDQNLTQNQAIQYMNILRKLALVTTIAEDSELSKLGLYPITPLQSEALLEANRLRDAQTTWEDLALILYDHSDKGTNFPEAKALYDSIKEHKQDLGLRNGDLEERLLIIHAGLDVDQEFPKRVKPKIIPGVTRVIVHPTLRQTGKNHNFTYGLENGLPSVQSLGTGSRTLWMPSQKQDIGLRVLYRNRDLNLNAWDVDLDGSNEGGRVTFAKNSA